MAFFASFDCYVEFFFSCLPYSRCKCIHMAIVPPTDCGCLPIPAVSDRVCRVFFPPYLQVGFPVLHLAALHASNLLSNDMTEWYQLVSMSHVGWYERIRALKTKEFTSLCQNRASKSLKLKSHCTRPPFGSCDSTGAWRAGAQPVICTRRFGVGMMP